MEIGGAERALLGLLETIDTTKYQVDLFLMRHEGELMKYIPETINLLPEKPQYACLAVPFLSVLKKGQLGMAIGRYLGKIKAAQRVKQLELPFDNDVSLQYSHKYTLTFVPNVSNDEYDLAISFLTPHYFVAEKVRAKKRIAWIHTDYSTVCIDKEEQFLMWGNYDWIASISDAVTDSFCKVLPELEAKIVLLPNIMPIDSIQKQAVEFDVETEMPNDGTIRLLSIGRFCTAKNFDNVPDICKRIREQGINAKWFLIGYGSDEALIRQKICETGMQDYVVILGKKENPYPYIKACDLYVQPSRYEGKCVSVIEAQILHKPVVISNYATSGSQLEDGVDGVIVPMDNQGCAEGIAGVAVNNTFLNELIENTQEKDYANRTVIERVYSLVG